MRDFIGLLAIVVAATALSVLALYSAGTTFGVRFETANELREVIARLGYSSHPDGHAGSMPFAFLIADRPLDQLDIEQVASRDHCGLTPSWKGVVWVCQIHSRGHDLVPATVGGNVRTWGNVLVAGDGDLMDRLEQAARQGAEPNTR